MAQVKKTEVRQALLECAFRLFSRCGYNDTTLSQIAAEAGVSTANVYVYFQSKLEMLFAIYEPWLRQRILSLEEEIATLTSPQDRLRRLLNAVWRELPSESNGFANNVMQAISSARPGEGYRPTLLQWAESRIEAMLREILPGERQRLLGDSRLSHVLMMAFDGFVINQHLNPRMPCSDQTIDAMVELLLATRAGAGAAGTGPRRKRPTRAKGKTR